MCFGINAQTWDYNLDNRGKKRKKKVDTIIILAVVFKCGFGLDYFAGMANWN